MVETDFMVEDDEMWQWNQDLTVDDELVENE